MRQYGTLCQLAVCAFFVMTKVTFGKQHFRIAIPGYVGLLNLPTITVTGPAFETGLQELQQYDTHFTVSHTYVYNTSVRLCDQHVITVQDMLARWYYREMASDNRSNIVIAATGCIEGALLNQLASSWNVLLLTSFHSDAVIRNRAKSPTWVTTSIAPSAYYGDLFYRFLVMHLWQSVYIVHDRAVTFYDYVAPMVVALLRKKSFLTVYVAYSSQKSDMNFTVLLKNASRESRGVIFMGQPPQLRELLVVNTGTNINLLAAQWRIWPIKLRGSSGVVLLVEPSVSVRTYRAANQISWSEPGVENSEKTRVNMVEYSELIPILTAVAFR